MVMNGIEADGRAGRMYAACEEAPLMPADMAPRSERSVVSFVLLECALSIPFWGIGALAQAHVIPDQVLFRAAWSLTPMMAASILVYRESKAAGVKDLFRRIVDYSR